MRLESLDVVVVGAGIIGCASARALADAGLRVGVVDPASPGSQASSAAAGLLSPQYECDGPGPLFQLGDRSRALYPEFAAELRSETGIDVELRAEGTLVLALTLEDESVLRQREAWQREADLAVELVEAEQLRELEPWAAPTARCGLFLPNDIQADNVKLCEALVAALKRRSVSWFLGKSASAVKIRDGRLEGVRLSSDDLIPAEQVVLAAGAWSGGLSGLPRRLPVRPIRGQMVQLEDAKSPLQLTLASRRGYVVPRLDGRILAGSTIEDVGFERDPTAAGVLSVFTAAFEIAPALSEARLTGVWAGLRPGTPDELPILGEDPEVPGLIYATGHFRNGILLAPITAKIVAGLAMGGESVVELSHFRAERFSEREAA